jgi:sugar lactone lactonase YvrE
MPQYQFLYPLRVKYFFGVMMIGFNFFKRICQLPRLINRGSSNNIVSIHFRPYAQYAILGLALMGMDVIGINPSGLAQAQTPAISTVVGNGVGGYTVTGNGALVEEGIPAINAQLFEPARTTVDSNGNLYIADTRNNRIRKVTPNGIITTIAGKSLIGTFSGDGGLATNAELFSPTGVAVDAGGNVYIADNGNFRIRRISPNGIITTIAGIGLVGSASGDGGPAISAAVRPIDLVVDTAGNLYFSDGLVPLPPAVSTSRIRKIDTAGIITTFAGGGLFTASLGDGGPAIGAFLTSPTALALDRAGNLYFTEASGNGRVRRISTSGTISTVAGGVVNAPNNGDGGPATSAYLLQPGGVAVDRAGSIFISETSHRIRRVSPTGTISTFAGTGGIGFSGDGGPAIDAKFFTPTGVTLDSVGNLYVADSNNHRIRKISDAGVMIPPLSQRGGIDLDGQGKSAVVVRATNASQLIAGRLVSNAFQWTNLPDPGPDFRLLAPIDFGGTGKSDLPLLRETPLNANGQGTAQFWRGFSASSNVVLRDVKPAWDVQAVGDLDGDGFGDLVWRFRGQSPNIDDQGVSYIWFTNGTGVAQVRKRGGAPLTWTLLGAADFNSDGAADMVYISPANAMRVLMATPNRTCANLNGGNLPVGFAALKLADFTAQKRGDILLRNPTTGEVRLLGLNATGLALPPYTGAPDDPNASCTGSTLSLTQTSFNIGIADPSWTLYATGDFNGDGIYDIVWKRPDNSLTVWLMAANGATPLIINNAGTAPASTSPIPLQ